MNCYNLKQTNINDFPKEWELTRLINIGNLKDGDWILKENYTNSGVRLLQIGDIGIGKFLNKSKRFISIKRARELQCRFIIPNEDILISRMPEPMGRACIAPALHYPYIVAVDISILKPNIIKAYPNYITYILNSQYALKQVKTFASGATRQRISRSNLERIKIPLPPLPEQKKIADILSTIDQAIEKVDEAIEKTERLKKGLMQQLWIKKRQNKKIKYIGKVYTGKTPPTSKDSYWNGNIPFITPADIKETKYVYNTARSISSRGVNYIGNILPKDTVIVVCIGSTIGKIGLTYKESVTNQQINSIICHGEINPYYVYYTLSLRKNLLKSYSGIAAIPIIKKSLFENIKIPLPPLPEQQKIVDTLSPVDKRLKLLREKKAKLENFKTGLMNDLLSGKKRVTSLISKEI